MAHQDRHVAIRLSALCFKGMTQGQIGREREYTCKPIRITQTGVQSDRTALREAGNDHPVRSNPRSFLFFDVAAHERR